MKIVKIFTKTYPSGNQDKSFEVCPTATCPVSHTQADHLVYTFGLQDNTMTEDQMVDQVKGYARRDTYTEPPPKQTTRKVSIKV